MTDIEQECIRKIAEAKAVSPDSITPETTLESLQVDSLDRVSLSFDMEEQYGIVIPDSQLQQILTVGDVAAAVEKALAKKQVAESSDAGVA